MLEGYGDFLNSDELSVELHISTWTARDWARKGILPSVKVGNRVLFPKKELAEYFESKLQAEVR